MSGLGEASVPTDTVVVTLRETEYPGEIRLSRAQVIQDLIVCASIQRAPQRVLA